MKIFLTILLTTNAIFACFAQTNTPAVIMSSGTLTVGDDTLRVVSDLTAEGTSDHLERSEMQISSSDTNTSDSNTSSGNAKKSNIGVRTKGSTKGAAAAMKEKLNHLVMYCAALY